MNKPCFKVLTGIAFIAAVTNAQARGLLDSYLPYEDLYLSEQCPAELQNDNGECPTETINGNIEAVLSQGEGNVRQLIDQLPDEIKHHLPVSFTTSNCQIVSIDGFNIDFGEQEVSSAPIDTYAELVIDCSKASTAKLSVGELGQSLTTQQRSGWPVGISSPGKPPQMAEITLLNQGRVIAESEWQLEEGENVIAVTARLHEKGNSNKGPNAQGEIESNTDKQLILREVN